jgi:peptide/nickel transport system permease protein
MEEKSFKSKFHEWKKAREPEIKEFKFILSNIRKSPLSIVGMFIIFFYVIVAISAPYLAPPYPSWDVAKINNPFIIPRAGSKVLPSPPSPEHPFGLTIDQYDIYYGCIWGSITAFRVGVYVVGISLLIGLIIGLIAGYYGGVIDEILMRFTDIILAFPGLILAMAFTIALSESLSIPIIAVVALLAVIFFVLSVRNLLKLERRELLRARRLILFSVTLVLIATTAAIFFGYVPNMEILSIPLTRLDKVLISLILVGWPGYTRVIRGEVLRTKNEDYVEAAKAVGCSDLRIILKHIVPNVIYPIIILASLDIGSVVLSAAALSFLGIGAEKNFADWGQLVQKSQQVMTAGAQSLIFYWYIWLIPGAFIFIFGLGWNLLGDAFRDILDPTLRRR